MGLDVRSPLAAGASVVSGPLTVAGGLVLASHVTSSGAAPGVVVGAGAGAGAAATMVAGSNDQAGAVQIVMGAGPAPGILATVTFAVAYGAPPHVVTDIVFNGAAGYIAYLNALTAGGFIIEAGVAFTAGTFLFPYEVIG